MPHGTEVVVQGLTRAPQHNGKNGTVVNFDKEKVRYQVQLSTGEWELLWLRPQNITQLCTVEVTGLTTKPELNGRKGEIFNYEESKRRYMVLVDGSAVSLQPANCILPKRTCVVIQGLSKSECNGQRAQIISIDRTAARYTVECETGKQIKIKYENVLC